MRGIILAGFYVLSDVLAGATLVGRPGSPQHWALVRLLAGVRLAAESLAARYRAAVPSARLHVPPRQLPPPVYESPGQLLPWVLRATDGATLRIFPGHPQALVPGRHVFSGQPLQCVSAHSTCSWAQPQRAAFAGLRVTVQSLEFIQRRIWGLGQTGFTSRGPRP